MERNDLYELCHNFTDAFHVLKCWFSKVHDSTSPLFLFGAVSLVAEPVYIAFLCKSVSRQIFLLCPFAVIVSCLEVSAFVKTAFFFFVVVVVIACVIWRMICFAVFFSPSFFLYCNLATVAFSQYPSRQQCGRHGRSFQQGVPVTF